jgi:antitoxin component YwqK of YwqJK toxin-antitoxin module
LKLLIVIVCFLMTSFSWSQDTMRFYRYYRSPLNTQYFANDSTYVFPYIKDNPAVYPFDYSIKQYNLEKLFEIFPFVEENGKVIPNKQFIAKDTASWLYKFGKSKFDGLNDFNPDDNIPPALESLPDGKYMQYYAPTYYTDKDTIKKIEKQVACVFYLKNNLLEGESFWFDEYGKLYKKGSYVNGKREGEWWFEKREEEI